jgi:putative transposase
LNRSSDIAAHLKEMYQIDVSAELISTVTDAVYPILYIDALQVKIKDQGHIVNKSVYLALGVNLHGRKEVLGLWIEGNRRRQVLVENHH